MSFSHCCHNFHFHSQASGLQRLLLIPLSLITHPLQSRVSNLNSYSVNRISLLGTEIPEAPGGEIESQVGETCRRVSWEVESAQDLLLPLLALNQSLQVARAAIQNWSRETRIPVRPKVPKQEELKELGGYVQKVQ